MAKLPVLASLRKEDYPDAPGWFSRLIGALNSFMEAVYGAMNRDITLADNIDSQVGTFTIIPSSLPYSFASTMKRPPSAVMVGRALDASGGSHTTISNAVWVDWTYEAGNIKIWALPGLTSSTSYQVTFLIL